MSNSLQRFTTSGLLSDRKVTQLMGFTVLTFVVFSYFSSDIFFSRENFQSMAYQVPEVAILSIAVMLSMLTGGIDLSIVGISNAAALMAAYIMTQNMTDEGKISNTWILIACLLGISLGLACGVINAVLISILNVTPILATLATMTLFNGIAIGITNGESISSLPEQFVRIGNGTFFGIPTPFVLMIMIAIVVGFIINN